MPKGLVVLTVLLLEEDVCLNKKTWMSIKTKSHKMLYVFLVVLVIFAVVVGGTAVLFSTFHLANLSNSTNPTNPTNPTYPTGATFFVTCTACDVSSLGYYAVGSMDNGDGSGSIGLGGCPLPSCTYVVNRTSITIKECQSNCAWSLNRTDMMSPFTLGWRFTKQNYPGTLEVKVVTNDGKVVFDKTTNDYGGIVSGTITIS